ncbi:hypothetical protein MIMGU_mgv1a017482mg [Erythranthe guttata]|uniref:Uncharacterized protein n=1 Tax=Erythranthe guttata TaxID=4155 RepID=A0A022Q5C5_ERYGU|nr:hypothetical protein MIMGU_mgv1a017482mg [Erythranthe guttata]
MIIIQQTKRISILILLCNVNEISKRTKLTNFAGSNIDSKPLMTATNKSQTNSPNILQNPKETRLNKISINDE